MTRLPRIRRIFGLPLDEDVRRELAFHLEMRTQELEEAGWEAAEARREAERLFGDLEGVASQCRAITHRHWQARRRADMFDMFRQDLRYAARALGKNPGFTAVALLTMALGIGATSAIFTVVHGVLLSPLPYHEPERLVTLKEVNEGGRTIPVSYANFADWKAQGRGFESMAVYSDWSEPTTILGADAPVRAVAAEVSANLFDVLGVAPIAGRTFLPEESRFGGDPAVVVSYGFWLRHLGGTLDLQSCRPLRIEGHSFRVIGVMPAGFEFSAGAELWYPRELREPEDSRTAHNWSVVARLAPEAELDVVRSEMNALASRLMDEYGDDDDAFGVRVEELRDDLVGGVRRPLTLLLAASALVLLVAAANLASTLMARAVSRRREMAVRTAIGAGRGRMLRQLLTETVLTTTLGGLAGLGLAAVLVRALVALRPSSLPRLDEITVDGTVLAFTLAVSILTGVVFGLAPALQASRTDLRSVLSEGGHQGAGDRHQGRRWSSLVAAEVALALVLLVGSGLLIRSFRELVSVDPGFTADEVLTFQVTVPGISLPGNWDLELFRRGEEKMEAFYRDFLGHLAAVPGVGSVGLVSNLPIASPDTNGAFVREGQPEKDYSNASYRVVGGDYFRVMGIPLVRGRLFDARESGGPHVALVNETFAERYFKGEEVLGGRIRSFGMDLWWDNWMTIVGVVGDVRHRGLSAKARPEIYVPYEQRAFKAWFATVVVKPAGTAAALAEPLRSRIRELYPELPVDFATMETYVVRSVEKDRFTMLLLASFAGLALLLTAIGIFGVVSYTMAQRTREIGIRIALGAGPKNVIGHVMRDALVPVVLGMVVGFGAALALSRFLASQLYDTSPTDLVTYLAMAAVLAMVAFAASLVPAQRTARIDPILAIRDE